MGMFSPSHALKLFSSRNKRNGALTTYRDFMESLLVSGGVDSNQTTYRKEIEKWTSRNYKTNTPIG